MKLKSGFMLRAIAGQWVVVPLGERVVEFNGIMTLNETAVHLWRLLEKGANEDELVKSLLSEYEVDADTATHDVRALMNRIRESALCEAETV